MQVLRIHISSDDDLFFLHTLEVSEEDFQSLKVEQVRRRASVAGAGVCAWGEWSRAAAV